MTIVQVNMAASLLTYHKNESQGDSALGGSELAYVAEQGNTEKEIGVLTLHSQRWLCNVMLCCAPLEKDGQ